MNKLSGKSSQKISKLGVLVAISLVSLIALSGCNKHKEDGASQTLAVVDGKEITVHQLNDELARLNVQPQQKDAATKQVIKALVDKQLLVNEAYKEKLDRNPSVLQAIERAKSQIMAQAYLESKLSTVTKPDKSEIDNYYNQHPEFFAHRQLVSMNQLVLSTLDLSADLKTDLDTAKTISDVSQKLDNKGVRYQKGNVTRVLGELAPNVQEKIKGMTPGQFLAVNAGAQTSIISVDGIKESPVKPEEAASAIENFLISKKRKDLGESEIENLRNAAKIEYTNPSIANNEQSNLTESKLPNNENASSSLKKEDSTKSSDIKEGVSGL